MSRIADDTDEAIIRQLEMDGRMSFREIGRQLGLSESTVRQRVRKLQDVGAIRVGVVVDLSRTGRETVAWLRLAVAPTALARLVKRLVEIEESTYVVTASGRYNVLAVVCVRDTSALLEFVDNRISTLQGVIDVDVRIAVRSVKHDYHHAALRR